MSSDEPSQPLSSHVAMTAIHRILEEGSILTSVHVRQRMHERGFAMHDVLNVLEAGQVKRPPRWSSDHHNWEYTVEGTGIDGESLTIYLAIDCNQEIITLITGF